MTNKNSTRILSLVVVLGMTLLLPQRSLSQGDPPPVQLRGTQVLHLTSAIVGQEYDLYVSLPRGYQDTTKKFPVIIVLDAQWDFALTYSIYGQQYYDGFIPAAIIVGVTWGGVNPNHDSLRSRDLTPINSRGLPQSGGGPKFLAFIKAELIPFIESKFRTIEGERTLMGSSFGGLFTLYALFHETALFNRYVLTSPPVGWGNGVLYTYEKEYAAKHPRLPVRLFMGIGGLEGALVSDLEKFVSQLKSRNYADLKLETLVVENIGHSGNKAEGYTRGLQAVFARPALSLTSEVLRQYTGKYRVNQQFVVEFVEDHGALVLLAPGNTRFELHAESDTSFYVKGRYMFLTFKRNEAGKVIGCEAEQYLGKEYAEKIG